MINALFIGDSFTSGGGASSPSKRFSTVLSARMGWTEYNYSNGGAGFTVIGGSSTGRTYLAQAEAAWMELDVLPDIIIVTGGQNDYLTNVVQPAKDWINYVRATWPQAQIVAVPGTYRSVTPPMETISRYWDWLTAFEALDVDIIYHAWTWLFGRPELMAYPNDPNHPNDAGHDWLANRIYTGLQGRETRLNTGRFALAPLNGYVNNNAYGQVIDGVAHLWGGLTKTASNIFYLDKPFSIPAWAAPGTDRRIQAHTLNGDNTTVVLRVSPAVGTAQTSTVQITNHQGTLSKELYLPAVSWAVGA